MLTLADDGAPPPPALFTVRLPVRWGDLDADGRVNNVTILRYAEEARMRFATRLALSREAPGMMPVVASLGCVYRAPMGYPCELDVRVGCGHVGRSSLGLAFEIADAASGAAYASACVTWVWVDKVSQRPVEMPAALRQFCLNPSTP